MTENEVQVEETQEGSRLDRLMFLHDQVMREQEMYWSRFYSFATLNAGAFLLATSQEFERLMVAMLGLGLSLAWLLVQKVGLGYVDRTKPSFHRMRRELGFYYSYGKDKSEKDAPDNPPGLLGLSWASATNIGLWVSLLVLAFWIYTLVRTLGAGS